jgi:ribosomal protein L11 methyltransferase
VVVANILADIIIGMIDAIASAMKPGTVFISSGIIDFKQNEVEEAFRKAGLTVIETGEQGEWRSVIGRK